MFYNNVLSTGNLSYWLGSPYQAPASMIISLIILIINIKVLLCMQQYVCSLLLIKALDSLDLPVQWISESQTFLM